MTSPRLLGLVALPALVSCSLFLDFDALQKGGGGAAGNGAGASGGSAGSGGSGAGATSSGGESGAPAGATGGTSSGTGGGTSEAGAAGSSECPAECFHDDPCLVDGCNGDGSCRTGTVTGLALDGIDQTIPADTQYRVTMIGGDDAFFLSSFAKTGNKPEVTFYRLDGVSTDFMPVATLGGLAIAGTGDPMSAAGLAWQSGLGLVHAFVALQDKVGMGARVWHVVLGPQMGSLPKPMAVSGLTDGYYAASPFSYPAAIDPGTQPYAAWLNADQSVSLSDGTNAMPQKLALGVKATTVSLVASDQNAPSVLYTVAGGGVFVETPSIPPSQISECQPAPGDYLSSSATFSNIAGLWLGGWTKYGAGYLTTNGRAIACGASGCASDMNACPADSESNLARNPATAIVHRPGDPSSLMEIVQATPVITTDGTNVAASIILSQQTAEIGLMSKPAKNIAPPITLATAPTMADAYPGPDWPAVAFVPPDRFAVAWTEPAVKGQGDELRIQRYKMCLPPPN